MYTPRFLVGKEQEEGEAGGGSLGGEKRN